MALGSRCMGTDFIYPKSRDNPFVKEGTRGSLHQQINTVGEFRSR